MTCYACGWTFVWLGRIGERHPQEDINIIACHIPLIESRVVSIEQIKETSYIPLFDNNLIF